MITEQAIVTRRDGKQVELKIKQESACGQCELNQGCGTGALGRLLGHRSRPLVIATDRDLHAGDRLLLGFSESALVTASLMIYGLPLLGMVIAGLIAAIVDAPEGLVTLASIVGFFLGFKSAVYFSKLLEHDLLSPYIIDVQVNPGPQSGS